VDVVAPPAALPGYILRAFIGASPATLPDEEGPGLEPQVLAAILGLLQLRSRHDLSEYKSTTLTRRVQRRMGVHGIDQGADYEQFVRENPQELDLLFKEMLIGVTSFFRDVATWDELKTVVMPKLLLQHPPGGRLRAWVAGCSTGEEAYSLAMVFLEVARALPGTPRTLQIFASDLSMDAIAVARRGIYPARVADEVGATRLEQFFVPMQDGFRVDKCVREMVLFAHHDVILDPPFTRLDLLSCRNLLIYFDAGLQGRLLPLFGYCLRPGGALLLGGSETVGRSQMRFTPVSPRSRLYWRNDNDAGAGPVEFPIGIPHRPSGRAAPEIALSPQNLASPVNLQSLAEQALLHDFSPPSVLVNELGDVLYIHGRVGRYLEPASGKANWNLHVMARPGLRVQVAAALRQAMQGEGTIELKALKLEDGTDDAVNVTVKPLADPKALAGLAMVVFRDALPARPSRRRGGQKGPAPDLELLEELQRWKDEVKALRQEMRASAEELQAANEELQSTNEELQSANEELTTSKEEAQSMNEELQTLNGELQTKLDDLALAQSDMQNLLNSTDIATLFLDSSLNLRRFTEQITRIIHLRESDIGRPLTDLASTLLYPDMKADVLDTLRSLQPSEKQVQTTDGLWFMVRIKPYRTLANVIQGVVITLIDITASKDLEARLRATLG
jgi:two-component system, chemotaxis family, CheB/CheR fusion protein